MVGTRPCVCPFFRRPYAHILTRYGVVLRQPELLSGSHERSANCVQPFATIVSQRMALPTALAVDPSLALVTLALASAVALFFAARRRGSNRSSSSSDRDSTPASLGEAHTDLLPVEASALVLGLPAICTATFYEGDCDGAEAHVRARVRLMIKCNPWLLGRLSWVPGEGPRTLRLSYCTQSVGDDAAVDAIFSVIDAPGLVASAPYEDIACALLSYRVPQGVVCIGASPPPPLLRITLLRSSPSSFVLFFSLSHVIGDGATFYELHSMLGMTAPPPRALSAQRHDASAYEARVDALMGGSKGAGTEGVRWILSCGSITRILCHMACARRPRAVIVGVPRAWVEREKAAWKAERAQVGAEGAAFVSTNDLVTSAVARVSGDELLLMAANLRGRVAGIGADDAGNYETLVPLLASDCATPSRVRAAIAGGRLHRPSLHTAALPGAAAALLTRAVVITNWASFYRDVQLPRARLVMHLPIAEVHSANMESVVVYAPRSGEVGVIALTRNRRLWGEVGGGLAGAFAVTEGP